MELIVLVGLQGSGKPTPRRCSSAPHRPAGWDAVPAPSHWLPDVVAERLGLDRDEALTHGRTVAGLNAQSKGQRLGVFKPHEVKVKEARDRGNGEQFHAAVCGRDVPAVVTADGVRAASRGKSVDADGVEEYLEDKFGDDL